MYATVKELELDIKVLDFNYEEFLILKDVQTQVTKTVGLKKTNFLP